jgi:hypothetical protein
MTSTSNEGVVSFHPVFSIRPLLHTPSGRLRVWFSERAREPYFGVAEPGQKERLDVGKVKILGPDLVELHYRLPLRPGAVVDLRVTATTNTASILAIRRPIT